MNKVPFLPEFFKFVSISDVVYFIVLIVSYVAFMIGRTVNDKIKIFGMDHGLIAALSRYLSGWTEENHQNLQDNLYPSQDSNLASPEYFFGYICNFRFLSDVRILLWCYLLLLHSRISIVLVPIVRVSVSSEPMRYSQGRFYAWYRIRLQCVFLCAHVSFRH
jgi:hypothetical protein